ncbi:LptF/LptG family permease [Mucisphaera calidilacus]|uniref:Putative permease YjgP/YjgQ family protein n=1 Tax=Mucisphaera calidilacus TaxID=2527982 RepID=A0A518BWB3_9BACT|nr:LptF/LptG family permease [Mucisphaera calidilacus]QDU71266.1 putative permease YjgP/YjgQ family protein [Mucisphaera calidilacus]
MSWILARYILFDIIKILVIVTATLVSVISFATAIKPLADGLLGPAELIRFVGYTIPTMLGFVLPFAGAFASTLVFIRLVADNEITAASACGVSHRALLMPVFGLGLVLTIILFTLSNFVVPGFYRNAAMTIEKDLLTVLVAKLNNRQPFTRGNWVVFADRAEAMDPPPPRPGQPAADKLVRLTGVAVQELAPSGKIRNDHTAQTATALLYQDPISNDSIVTLRLDGFVSFSAVEGDFRDGYIAALNLPPLRLPSVLRDNPKFYSWPELRDLTLHPERYDRVRDASLDYLQDLATHRLVVMVREALQEGLLRLKDPVSGRLATLTAPQWQPLRRGAVVNATESQPILYQLLPDDDATSAPLQRPMRAGQAFITVKPRSESTDDPRLTLELRDITLSDGSLGLSSQISRRLLPELAWPDHVLGQPLNAVPTRDLIAGQFAPQSEAEMRATATSLAELQHQIRRLASRIMSQLHVRAALAIACCLLTLLGATIAMNARNQSTLVAYTWSFLAAIITIIIVHSGENVANRVTMRVEIGLALLWSAILLLLIACAVAYARLGRPT